MRSPIHSEFLTRGVGGGPAARLRGSAPGAGRTRTRRETHHVAMPYAEVCTIAASPGFSVQARAGRRNHRKNSPSSVSGFSSVCFSEPIDGFRLGQTIWHGNSSYHRTSPKQARREEPSKHGGGMRPDRRLAPLVVVIALLTLPQSATAAGPLIVGDGTPASCTEAALQQAVAVAAVSDDGTIRFKCGTDPVTITLTTTLTPPNNTTIDGGGVVTLAGIGTSAQSIVFVAPDTTVVLKNLVNGAVKAISNEGTLIVKNNRFSGNGQGIENGGTLEVAESIFSSIGGGGLGSAIFNSGTLKVKNSMFFSNNGSDFAGVAIYNAGGNATVDSSTFFDNHSEGGNAILNGGTLTVDNSMFVHNGGECGGAILNLGTLTVKNSMFSDNHAGGALCDHGGGAIQNSGTLVIYNSELLGNTAGQGGG